MLTGAAPPSIAAIDPSAQTEQGSTLPRVHPAAGRAPTQVSDAGPGPLGGLQQSLDSILPMGGPPTHSSGQSATHALNSGQFSNLLGGGGGEAAGGDLIALAAL